MPARGLPQGCCCRRHTPLCLAWRWQALPTGGLLQVRSWRYATLQGARGRQAVPARGLPQVSRRRRHAACTVSCMEEASAACQQEDCTKSAQGDTQHCKAHGGGKRCMPTRGLHQVRSRRYGALRLARWRQALPARRLPQIRPRRYTALYRAWRRQAVPTGGLLQVRCRRRHPALHRPWRRQALPARGLPQGGP
jgi:hypothetical protein